MKSTLMRRIFCVSAVVLAAWHAPAAPQPRARSRPSKPPFATASNAFALDLYGRLGRTPGNLFFSPFSISTAFAMAHAGAKGETASQMASVFRFGDDAVSVGKDCADLLRRTLHDGDTSMYQLAIANALFGQSGYGFLPSFVKGLRTSYGAELREVDFRNDPESARATINRWVEERTRDKIREILLPKTLSPDTRLVLANAVYFKADWQQKFDPSGTRSGEFRTTPTTKVTVPMMRQVAEFGYSENADFQAISMGYSFLQTEMVVLLPKKADGLARLEQTITADSLDSLPSPIGEESRLLDVMLPRFEATTTFQLEETLPEMGMPLAFDSVKADFSGVNGGKQRLWIGRAIHKAFVRVNEEGTEAAAATLIELGLGGLGPKGTPIPFHADHPFLFLIRHRETGVILFMGRVTDPSRPGA